MADGGRLPLTPGWRCAGCSVAACDRLAGAGAAARRELVERRRRSRRGRASGDCSTRGLLLNAMTPTLTVLGTLSTKRLARGARRRPGGWARTSVACIEPLTSVTSMIDARSTGTATVFCGRAAARMRIASASRKASIGTWRRQRGRLGATDGGIAGAAKAAAARRRSRWLRAVEHDEHRERHEEDEHQGRAEADCGERDEAHGVRAGRFCSVASRVTSWPVRSTRMLDVVAGLLGC